MSCTGNLMIEDGTTIIQQLPEKRSYLINTNDNVIYRKMQVHLKPYIPNKKVKQPELCKINNDQSADNNQSEIINQRPKCTIKPSNRLNFIILHDYILLKNQLDSIYMII